MLKMFLDVNECMYQQNTDNVDKNDDQLQADYRCKSDETRNGERVLQRVKTILKQTI